METSQKARFQNYGHQKHAERSTFGYGAALYFVISSNPRPHSLDKTPLHLLHWYTNLPLALGLKDSPRLSLGLLRLFTSVEDLYLSRDFLPPIVSALHGPGGGITEVLPSLQNLFLERESLQGPVEETIGQFVAAPQLSSRPMAVSQWNRVRDPGWQPED